ncbi:MAG: hypothetical protein P1U87_19965 [Verrucomicrobiales bacterium]|nr:hypothetical protein [Verrucomicrobiales bacterium]
MNRFFFVAIFAFLPAAALAAKVELPEWGEPTEAAAYQLGGGLWPTGVLGDAEEEATAEAETEVAKTADAKTSDAKEGEKVAGEAVSKEQALKFYGPAGEVDSTEPITADTAVKVPESGAKPVGEGLKFPDEEPAQEAPVEALPPLEGKLADTYFEHAPMDFLIDPQRLLTEQKSNDIKRFLEFHSDESEFHIYVMVFGETQKIPDDVNLRQLHKEWFSESPTVMMLYYREHPEMTEFVYNDNVSSALPKSVFDRIRQNCLREGGATDLAPDQVEKMAIELSIQLYWLSRLMKHETKEGQELAAETEIYEMPASADAPELLREYAPGIFLEEKGRKVLSMIFTTLLILGTVLAVAAVGWGVMWWRNRDRVAGKPLLFPSFEIIPRLGGEYSGGGFVSMSFEINEGSDFSA